MTSETLHTNGVDFSALPVPVLDAHPEWVALHDFAWHRAAHSIRQSPKRRYLDDAWDPAFNYQWVWDTCFIALYCRYGGGQFPGIESLDNFYDLQRDDGYISMTYEMTTGTGAYPPGRINPPLFAWAEWEHYRTTGDASRFARVLPNIERLVAWIDANRRTEPHPPRAVLESPVTETGDAAPPPYRLYYFEDCGSSGMDDSPRTPRLREAGQFFEWIDLSSQMALCFRCLAAMHDTLGHAEQAAHWRERHEALGKLINAELWCERTRFYHDRMLPLNFVGHKTAAAFWPLVAGICPADRVEALVAHLLDEREFFRPLPVPCLSADDPNYSPQGRYWHGSVWPSTNYMITRGLDYVGRGDVGHRIACRYVDGLAKTFAAMEPHTLWEAYSPEEPLPARGSFAHSFVKPHFVGWAGIGPIAMLYENVLGIDLDTPRRLVTWNIRLSERHGLRNLPVGREGVVDLLCAQRSGSASPAQVEVQASVSLQVNVLRGDREQLLRVNPGSPARAKV